MYTVIGWQDKNTVWKTRVRDESEDANHKENIPLDCATNSQNAQNLGVDF